MAGMCKRTLGFWVGLVLLPGAAAWGQEATRQASGPGARPNMVLIVADDLGYADLGCQGATDVRTPHIDTLAREGVRFTDGYVSCPVCSPTRAGLLTGRYQQRFGHEFNPGPANAAAVDFGLPLTERTLPEYLKAAGYTPGMVGKWHLGYQPAYLPGRRGFDEFFGFAGGAHSYVDARADGNNPILRGTTVVDEKEYLTDAFAREAVAFIDRHAREPFFLYLAFNAVHTPMQAPEKYLARFADIANTKRRTLAAMLSAMDDAVGAVLAKLREAGVADNTLIFFISDNGGPTQGNGSRNTPLSGFKGDLLEGGIRVPFIVHWKGRLEAGKVYREPVIALDILPTLVAAAGGSVPAEVKLDGVNLLPFLTGERQGSPHEALFWRQGRNMAVRRGNDKLLIRDGGPPQLFNLADDIGEQRDLAAEKPAKAQELSAALKKWNATLMEPLWQRRVAPRAGQRQAQTRPAERRGQDRPAERRGQRGQSRN